MVYYSYFGSSFAKSFYLDVILGVNTTEAESKSSVGDLLSFDESADQLNDISSREHRVSEIFENLGELIKPLPIPCPIHARRVQTLAADHVYSFQLTIFSSNNNKENDIRFLF